MKNPARPCDPATGSARFRRAGRTRVAMLVALCLCPLGIGNISAASYRAFPPPVASPDHGVRPLLVDPHDPLASPFGWHDTNGAPGAEFTTLLGNNVRVYLDVNADSVPDGPGPDGGPSLTFDASFDPTQPPSSYYAALAINAFHWYNRLHDIFYRHGFTPVLGNMQHNTYGQGGVGNDALRVEIANGTQFNNLSPFGAADGASPRIVHYVWNMTNPHRETSFDGTVMTWGFASVMYPRLNPGCQAQAESPHVGYADFFSMLVTADFTTDTPAMPRGLGTYAMGQPVSGAGIRGVPYSTDLALNPRTYANLPGLLIPHQTGTVWASALWDATWAMVQRYGASHDLLTGFGGENRMLRIGIEAIVEHSCPVGFVSARNEVLSRDLALYGGDGRCALWGAFARRGLGFSAAQGSPSSTLDGTAAFDLPPDCADQIFASGLQ
jgi:extracellular elastinolytic metalloproteinase